MQERTVSLETEKRNRIKIARQLLYPEEVFDKIEAASTFSELDRIMHDARAMAINKN